MLWNNLVDWEGVVVFRDLSQCVMACHSVLWCVLICFGVLGCVVVRLGVLWSAAMLCSESWCFFLCLEMLQDVMGCCAVVF